MSPPIGLYRLGNKMHKLGLKRLGKFISWTNRFLFSVWLPSSAEIGKNLIIGYWGLGLVVHSKSVIGNNCTIGQNVTIGKNLGDVEVPVIGDNVYIGTGSVIFGEITIGNNAIIGANSLVNKSVPDNAIVAGNPFKIIRIKDVQDSEKS